MDLASAYLHSFFTYEENMTVCFPAHGVTMLVGENGSGKSALAAEVVPWVLWGETVRGVEPVLNGDAGVLIDGHHVRRVRSGGKVQGLVFEREGRGPDGKFNGEMTDLRGQTPTETQAKINQVFGDWRRFANTRVFSRALLAKFGTATNKERQVLLETLLGLEQFSRAEKMAREAMRQRKDVADKAYNDRSFAEGAFKRSSALAAAAEPEVPARDISGFEVTAANAVATSEVAVKKATRAADVYVEAERRVLELGREASDIKSKALVLSGRIDVTNQLLDCPVCLRAVDAGARGAVQAHYVAERTPLLKRGREIQEEIEVLRPDLEDMRIAMGEAATRRNDALRLAREQEEALRAAREEVSRAEARRAAAQKARAAEAQDKRALDAAELVLAKAQLAVTVAEAAVAALGPRGARVRVLGEALRRLEGEANAVLARLGTPIRVAVSGKKTQASGREVEEVSLQLVGAGGGQYSGASEGERTRVDVALLLALSRMAGQDGLLVFDEIFDPLDDDGLERVAELLEEMGRTRQVLVTSHSEKLQTLVPAAQVWRVRKVDGVSTVDVGT